MIDLSVIIVSFNTRRLLEDCIKSIQNELEGSSIKSELIVIDNGSSDNSQEFLRKEAVKIKLIVNSRNEGFGKANNQGAEAARGRYLLFLNSDTIVEKGALSEMISFLDRNPKIGIASCQLKNFDGRIQYQGGYLPGLLTVMIWAGFLDDLPVFRRILPSYQSRRKIRPGGDMGWVGGTAMFVRKQCWNEAEGFDENIFMYGEDVELCYRAKRKGWKIVINPRATIRHLGKGSGQGQAKWVAGEIRGLFYFFHKHKPGWEMPILRLILKLGMGSRWLVFGILSRNERLRKAYAEAWHLA